MHVPPHRRRPFPFLSHFCSGRYEASRLWDRALKMLQCHRQNVPTLLGLCVVAVAQIPGTAGQKAKEARVLPAGLQKYVLKLREWTGERAGSVCRSGARSLATSRFDLPEHPLRLTRLRAMPRNRAGRAPPRPPASPGA